MLQGQTKDRELSLQHFDQLEQAIYQYIDFCNNERIKAKLKGLPPKNYRRQTFEFIY